MKSLNRPKNKGQAQLAITIATMAVVLIVVTIVIAQLITSLGTGTGLTGQGLAAFNNITNYTWTGILLTAIGIIVVAGFGLIGLMLFRRK